MNAYSYSFSVNPSKISYGEMEFNNFRAREVLVDGDPKGEYHIAPIGMDTKVLLSFMKRRLSKYKVGIVDPSGVLNLEYPLYVMVEDEMAKACMNEIFDNFDKELS